jgi:hypothetical protein
MYLCRTGPTDQLMLFEAQLIAKGYRRADVRPDGDLAPHEYRLRTLLEAQGFGDGTPRMVLMWREDDAPPL